MRMITEMKQIYKHAAGCKRIFHDYQSCRTINILTGQQCQSIKPLFSVYTKIWICLIKYESIVKNRVLCIIVYNRRTLFKHIKYGFDFWTFDFIYIIDIGYIIDPTMCFENNIEQPKQVDAEKKITL